MITVRIARAERQRGQARPIRSPGHVVVLADDAGGREPPVWLTKFDGDRLVQLVGHGRAEADAPLVSTAEELTVRQLRR